MRQPWIDRLRDECPVALAVSLHAPTNELRDRLVPINRKHPLESLMAACLRYLERAPRDFVTFEYVMLDGVNDSVEHAHELVDLLDRNVFKVNLIPYNPTGMYDGSSRERIAEFKAVLDSARLPSTVRLTRGRDIAAACGQLAATS